MCKRGRVQLYQWKYIFYYFSTGPVPYNLPTRLYSKVWRVDQSNHAHNGSWSLLQQLEVVTPVCTTSSSWPLSQVEDHRNLLLLQSEDTLGFWDTNLTRKCGENSNDKESQSLNCLSLNPHGKGGNSAIVSFSQELEQVTLSGNSRCITQTQVRLLENPAHLQKS